MPRLFHFLWSLGACAGLALSNAAQAKVFQVNQPSDLQPALNEAASNGEADTLEIEPGTWRLSEANNGQTLRYIAADTENFPLEIVGKGFDQTILDGEGAQAILSIRTIGILTSDDSQATVTVRKIAFRNGNSVAAAGGGLSILTQDASVRVEACSFSDNTTRPPGLAAGGGAGGGLSIRTTGTGDAQLVNNLFHRNRALQLDGQLGFGGGASLTLESGTATLLHNTLFANQAERQGGGLHLNLDTAAQAVLFNNIVFGNEAPVGGDIQVSAETGSVQAFNNDFSNFCLAQDCDFAVFLGNGQGGNLSADPSFVDSGQGDLRLAEGSPLIDRGSAAAPELPVADIVGNPRIAGEAPDMGAFEFIAQDGNGDNNGDNGGAGAQSGGCSLRSGREASGAPWVWLSCFAAAIGASRLRLKRTKILKPNG